MQGFVSEQARPRAEVHTDSPYASEPGFRHESVGHPAGEFVRGRVRADGIESSRALLWRGSHGTCLHLSVKHPWRCLDEFSGRESGRSEGTSVDMRWLAQGLWDKLLIWKMLTGKARIPVTA